MTSRQRVILIATSCKKDCDMVQRWVYTIYIFVIVCLSGVCALADTASKEIEASFKADRAFRMEMNHERLASLVFPKSRVTIKTYSNDYLRSISPKKGGREWKCLTDALYFEARGESIKGQFAVAEVILNRVDSKRYPDTICSVVHQGSSKRNACQFSFMCDGHKEIVHEPLAYDRSGKIASLMMDGSSRLLTAGALYYHNTSVSPRWARSFVRTARIGQHVFYAP